MLSQVVFTVASALQSALDEFVAVQKPLSLQRVLDNIGPEGVRVPGAAAGLVVASPSTSDPDYFYTWTRDAALTFKMLVDEFVSNVADAAHLEPYIKDYIRSQAILQTVANPSGSLLPQGDGLGEAKFHVDGSRFNENWGRPQRDGPPLRAVALITYAKWLAEQGMEGEEEAREVVWPVILNDLSYVGQYWNASGFDLWEEVNGSSFFTTQAQYRALIEGSQLASRLGLSCGETCEQAPHIACFLHSAYWNGEFFVGNINSQVERSGRDANVMLATNHAFDLQAGCESPVIQPCASRALASFKSWVDGFRDAEAYPINAGVPQNYGVALGRYTEDVYYGGHPWYLITSGAAEYLYSAVARWKHQGSVAVDSTSLSFFADLYPGIAEGTYFKPDEEGLPSVFGDIVNAVTSYADSFAVIVQRFTPEDGSLAEQFDRYEPFQPVGAPDLTWSYAAFITMASRRAGLSPSPWVPENLSVPSECVASSAPGVYAPAVAAGAPNQTEGLCSIPVNFNVLAPTYFGEDVYVVGSASALGNWDVERAHPLSAAEYTEERPLWSAEIGIEVDIPEDGNRDGEEDNGAAAVSYVYVRKQDCEGGFVYETTNRSVAMPKCEGNAAAETDDSWEGPRGEPGNC